MDWQEQVVELLLDNAVNDLADIHNQVGRVCHNVTITSESANCLPALKYARAALRNF